MNGSMINAMVSMNGLQQKLDLLADNIANANTVGYKRKEASFEDLLATKTQQPSGFTQPGRLTPLGFNQGWGSKLGMIQPDLAQGPLKQTDEQYDVALTGDALLEVITDAAGTRAYTRNGALQLTLDDTGTSSFLTTKEGYAISDVDGNPIEIPSEIQSLRINPDGSLIGETAAGAVALGQMRLVQAMKPSLLSQVADNLYTVADGINVTDVLRTVTAAADSDISIRQGYLEQSNVNLANEMTELINVQRAYQLSSRALSSSDTMLGLANSLRG
ncbi:flagellar hook-basal body protein [Paenibacillus mendelii]|uniref:Flagellar hook-basal body protein n=1 Tax=Paenibacillus mendelii TaxID=206163 RepID=A0ABV6J3R1_9BACL|nr:flagellar hook-basal body protein [Paenibacillus mendelii]MCQ6561901.1 flagellar hook-basal body protein [Paenibacillus mendelii]